MSSVELNQTFRELERELEGLIALLETRDVPVDALRQAIEGVGRSFAEVRARRSELAGSEAGERARIEEASRRTVRLHAVVMSLVSCEFDGLQERLGRAREAREHLGALRAGPSAGRSCDVSG